MATKVSEIERPNDVPEKIGKYVIINKIGKGSTGTVTCLTTRIIAAT